MVGGVGFFERAEVKDLLAYARLALNPLDAVSLKRVLNTPLGASARPPGPGCSSSPRRRGFLPGRP